jgi:arsenical pump membrane protein
LLQIVLLIAGVVSMLFRPQRWPLWIGPATCALVGLATTAIELDLAGDGLRPLRDPLLFLVFAVPLAVTLDAIGVFAALAATLSGGRHLIGWLWLLAAGVVIVFNLDAAVVLLTPLYIQVARRHGYPLEALAFQPALLACLASGPLPVSNLTNLIAAERFDLDVGDFIRHMSLPTLAAVAIGYLGYRWAFDLTPSHPAVDSTIDAHALRRGLPVIGFVLAGFTAGDAIGIPAWVIAAIAFAWCSLLAKRVAWKVVPIEAILIAASMGVLVAAAGPHLALERIFDHAGVRGELGALGFGVIGSNLTNNLPAVLAGVDSITRAGQVWPLLIGVNIGPLLVLTGSLSTLLWRDTAARAGVEVSPRRFSRIGLRVGLPALVCAAAVSLLTGALT